MFLDDDVVVVARAGARFPEGLFDRRGRPLSPMRTRVVPFDATPPRDARTLLLVNPTAGQLAATAAGAPAGVRILVLVDVETRDQPFSIVNGV
ncbi:hypothetical protein SB87_gp090 [Parapoxvirus red deer/HL953]|uniref:Uncharacterized protein n=1 Tax=Parapoxvirus red deer/HL953 TaxID=1579460 RepID=A0A0A7MAA7_9POXV|nr:hypothetical protein SB87_gp090 [Parapoxvirus red deer/HL953]AIZ77343.1 hypothetical protein [Parapoxvirus red deer/HL953]